MPFALPTRLTERSDASQMESGASPMPSVDTSVGASPAPPVDSPDVISDMEDILGIVSRARKLATKYPEAVPAVQAINAAVQELQMAITSVQQPAEPMAPPM